MQILHPTLSLYFVSTGLTKTTTYLVQDSINITKQLYNDLHSSSNSCSLQIRSDSSALIEDIIKDDSDIKATLTDGATTLFTGILSNEHTWRVSTTGEDVFQVKIEDIGTRYLNKPLVDDDDTCIRDTLQNVINSIATRCSISAVTFDSSVTSAIKNKELINKVSSSMTCKDALDAICYEFGLVYYFNESGVLVIKKTGALNGSPSTTIATTGDYAHYLYEDNKVGVDLTRKSRQYSQAKVQYSTISDSVNAVPIYAVTEKIEVPASEWWDGATHTDNIYEYTLDEFFVADKKYYTFNGTTYVEATVTVGDPIPDNTYFEYAGTASLIDMVDSTNGKDILYVYSDSIIPNLKDQTSQYPGYVERVAEPLDSSRWTLQQHKNTTKMEVLIDNTQGGLTSIYTLFQAKGRIIRKQGTSNIYRSLVGLTANSEVQFNYESQWIHDKNDAIALCEMLSNYYLYCDNTYTFYCKDDLDLGSVVRVYENLYSGLDVNMLLTAKQYTGYRNTEGLYKYTAQGITAFNLNANTRVENYEVPTGISSLVSTNTMYALSDQGVDSEAVTGWQSTVPTVESGEYLWTRIEYAYSDGTSTFSYSVSYVADTPYSFILNVTPTSLVKNTRLTSSQTVTATCTIEGYEGTPTISYYYGDEGSETAIEIVAQTVTFSIPYNQSHPSLIVEASLAGAKTQVAELSIVDDTDEYRYNGTLSIDTSKYFNNGVLVPTNYSLIDWSSTLVLLGADERFIDGDSFFNNYSKSGFTDVYVYVYEQGKWVPISFSNLSNAKRSMICSQAMNDVLSTIETGTVTKSDFGYFNTIITETVTADYIGGKEIEVREGGFIYSGDVDISQPAGQRVGSTGAGFCFDSNGNAEMSNIRITGESTIEGGSTVLGTLINYDTNQKPVFKTVKESTANVSMSGSKADGTNAPNAYIWKSFYTWLENGITSRATSGTYYSTSSSTLYGTWSGGAFESKSVIGIKYWSSVPTSSSTVIVHGSRGAGTSETKTMYTNSNSYWETFNKIICHPKTDHQVVTGQTGYGKLKVTVYYSNGTEYQVICNTGKTEGYRGSGVTEVSNVRIPPGGYIVAVADPYGDYFLWQDDTDLYLQFTSKESDMFSTGINLITSDGYIYQYDYVIPDSSTYSTYPQVLTCSGLSLSLNMTMTASSSWPIEKYYRFNYSLAPSISATVTASIFNSQSFSYRGVTKTVSSITYSRSYLKVITTDGNVYEFYTATGYYYPRHSFSFTTLGESLGAYSRSMLPTDDPNTHNVGASNNYSSGVSQRWNTGFFTSLDVSQGIIAKSINAGWLTQTITVDTTLSDDFAVGTMRPFYVQSSGSSGPKVTMPGDSSHSYTVFSFRYAVAVVAGASCVARDIVAGGSSLSTSGYVSAAQPWCILLVLRTS